MFRRKQLLPEFSVALEGFHAVLAELEPAKAGLTDVLPGTRMPGRPLHDALAEFEERLARAASLMPPWRRPEVEEQWQACEEGLARARGLANAVREGAREPEGFEGLLGLVSSLLDPLEPFADAEERFRRLRR